MLGIGECEERAFGCAERDNDGPWQEGDSSEIVISNLQLVAPLIFHPSDTVRSQLLYMDLVAHGDLSLAAEQDNLMHSVSYSAMAKLVRNYTDTLPTREGVTLFQYMSQLGDLMFQSFPNFFAKSESHWLSMKAALPKYSLAAKQVGLEWKRNASGSLMQGTLFISGFECMAKIGVNDWERLALQPLSLTVALELPIRLFTTVLQYPLTLFIASLAHLISATHYLTVEAVSQCIAHFLSSDYGFPKFNLHLEKLNAIPSAASAGIRLVRSIRSSPRRLTGIADTIAYLALGSNMGDRLAYIQQALSLLATCPALRILDTSMMYETKPMYYLDQGLFLNCVCKVSTSLSLEALMEQTQQTEAQIGRSKWIDKGPRSIDIDILFYGDHIVQTNKISVPHPGLCEREFVLRPLTE